MYGIGTANTVHKPNYYIRKSCTKVGVDQNVPVSISRPIRISGKGIKIEEVTWPS